MKKSMNVLEYMRSITQADTHDFSQSPLSQWAYHWLNQYCTNIKESTFSSYDTVIKLHINRVLGEIRLNELTSEDVQLFINSLTLGVGIDEPLSPKSIRNVHGVLHKCLSVAVNDKQIPENPANLTILPRVIKPDIKPLTPEQLNCFLNAGLKRNAAQSGEKLRYRTKLTADQLNALNKLGITFAYFTNSDDKSLYNIAFEKKDEETVKAALTSSPMQKK